ncbi:MAG TPA: glycine/sarcosine/betaine reductase selenoprotein B family protein [Pyrinomonadaceae bacterium]|nr:glycine/sarcosine/betaine reductase selenoprotein B family protein [Pyrinomonadaceae bacterium]
MDVIEQLDRWQERYGAWRSKQPSGSTEDTSDYPFIENARAPFTPARRALPMLNLALISSAGAYIDGTDPFDTSAPDGDFTFREMPSEIDPSDLRFSTRGYDSTFVQQDPNVQVPLARLFEFESNRIIGQLNTAFWSFCGFSPDAARMASEMLPKLVERLTRYEIQAALLIPASRLCHQSVALAARAIESAGIPTMMLAVEREVIDKARPPRAAFYEGQFGSVAGNPNWPEHQRRILDEALRWIEPMGEPGISKLSVEIESQVQHARGER